MKLPLPLRRVFLPVIQGTLLGVLPMLLAGCAAAPAPADRATSADPVTIVKSPNDDRDYRYLTLDNGLRVLLVSDPTTDQAAASLVVFRGSYDEPAAYPGLAHFLEHMLFIGTEKYPDVDAYQEFIGKHGGSSNAYTAGDHTNYFFDVQPEQFRPAMDRFSQFFISPLFAADYVDREKNAVNSEYQMQIKADEWRGGAVVNAIMNPQHPQSRFNIGSLETLGDGVRDALLDYFHSAYSADQMVLVALSSESTGAMAEWVAPMFSAIENRHLGPQPARPPMFRPDQLPAAVRYRTIKDGYRVVYNFPVPPVERHFREKPAEYVSNLLGHEGEGSLHQRLQDAGWIESLAAGTGSFDPGNSLLVVDIGLTDEGYANLDKVTDALFDYVALLGDNPPEAWRYEEQAEVAELGFRFQEKSSPTGFVYQVAPRFLDYPPAEVLAAPYLMTRFDPALIEQYVDALTEDNVLVEISGPDVETTAVEPWFDVPYALEQQAPRRGNADTDLAQPLELPAPNPYLPEDLDVLPDEPAPPQRAVERPGVTLWADRDTEFRTPRANLYLSLGVEDGIATAEDMAMASLYARLVRDALGEAVYPAYLAGLGYGLDVDGYGFELAISGYSDKQLTLLDTVLDALTGTHVDPQRFAVLQAELVRDWNNYRDERPYTQAYGALGYLLLSSRWPPEALIDALEGCNAEQLTAWRDERLGAIHVLGLDHGNIADDAAPALAATLAERLSLDAFPRYQPRVTDVEGARRYQLDIDHGDAAMVLYLQDPDASIASRARSALTANVLRQAYFTSLRTEQQLGYVVTLTSQTVRDRGGLAFIVQSPAVSAAELERRTRDFLVAQQQALQSMPEDAFASYQQGLIAQLTERDRNLGERGARLWTDLDLGVTTFDSRTRLADAVAALDKDALLAYLAQTVERFDRDRLLVFSKGQFDDLPPGTGLDSVSAFKG